VDAGDVAADAAAAVMNNTGVGDEDDARGEGRAFEENDDDDDVDDDGDEDVGGAFEEEEEEEEEEDDEDGDGGGDDEGGAFEEKDDDADDIDDDNNDDNDGGARADGGHDVVGNDIAIGLADYLSAADIRISRRFSRDWPQQCPNASFGDDYHGFVYCDWYAVDDGIDYGDLFDHCCMPCTISHV